MHFFEGICMKNCFHQYSVYINILIIITEKKMQQNLRNFNLKILFKFKYPLRHRKILFCVIKNYL